MDNISVIESNKIPEIKKNIWESFLWEQDLIKNSVKYILENNISNNIEFDEEAYLIQRMSITNNRINYDYMWSSEFEFWWLSEAMKKLIKWHENWELVLFSSENWEIKWLCHKSLVEKTLDQIKKLLNWEHQTLEPIYKDKFSNFLCFENAYFFSTSWNTLDYLAHIENTAYKNNHIKKIENHPKFKKLKKICKKLDQKLQKQWINISYISPSVRPILEKTIDDWIIEENDFETDIWINSNHFCIETWWFSENDIKEAIRWTWKIYTDAYWEYQKRKD